jgi:TrmH family RNA methyltransferase
LDGLQDPGNTGAIVRAAEAFGATGAIFLKGTVSPYNPKAVRASAGSLFRLPVLHGMDAECARRALAENCVRLFAAVPAHPSGSARLIGDADLTSGCALIIGNEARGVSPELRSVAEQVSIPTVGVESLNAAMAAGILLYEARRQRTPGA